MSSAGAQSNHINHVSTQMQYAMVVAGVCAVLFVLAIVQSESGKLRIIMMVNALLWIIYDYKTKAYTNILTHGLELLSILIAMVRLDRKSKKQVQENHS